MVCDELYVVHYIFFNISKFQGKNVCYLYLDPGHRYVGRGMLHNDLTDRILHGVSLEAEYVKVQFEVAEKSEYNAPLPRPCDEVNLVGQAPGYFLAWPRELVSTKIEVKHIKYKLFSLYINLAIFLSDI